MRIVFLSSYRRIINTEVFFFQEAFAVPNTSVIIQKQRTLLITFNQTMLDDKLKLAEKMAEERSQRKKKNNYFFKFLQNVYSILDLEFTKSIIISTLLWCSLRTANAPPEMRLLARPEIRLLFAGYPRCGASSETQGQSFGSGERARRNFLSTGERASGYRLSPSYFQ